MAVETRIEDGRRLNWDACYNVRETGGYAIDGGGQTRWGALLRADNLCRLTPDGQAALIAYGVRTIVDLRSSSELAHAPHPFAGGSGEANAPRHLHRPLLDEDDQEGMAALDAMETMQEQYCAFLSNYPRLVAAAMRAVAEAPEGGVLIHCFAGKDRTGVIVALALELAGVARATIAEDYALSDTYLGPLYDQLLSKIDDPARRERTRQRFRSLPETILGMLAYLDSAHGGVAPYLLACGLDESHLERIRARLRDTSNQ